jgi:hypothetical protein
MADGMVGMAVTADGRSDVKAAFILPTSTLVKAWPALAHQAIPPCPYRGLFAFREQDGPFFFGRDEFVAQLVDAVWARPLVAVIGPSGNGKSSVVYAGLLPRLRADGSWIVAAVRPGDRPLHTLAATLIPLLEVGMSETDQLLEVAKLGDALERGELALLQVVGRVLGKHPEASRLLLIADQFEELYTLGRDRAVQQRFLDQLLAGTQIPPGNSPCQLTLVLTLRADFLGHALSYRPFADALRGADLKLGPMTRQELESVIERPARQLGVRVEDDLTERILDAVSDEPGDLPLLEFALTELWGRQEHGRLTHEAYDAIGGVERALTTYADEVFGQFDPEAQERARQIFVQLVRPGEGTVDTRRQALRTEVGEQNWDLVSRLATSRLVVSGRDDVMQQVTVEIVHEALIGGWQRLRE